MAYNVNEVRGVRILGNVPRDIGIRPAKDSRETGYLHWCKDASEVVVYPAYFEAGLRLPFPYLLRNVLNHVRLPPARLHPDFYRIVMGCIVLNKMLDINLGVGEIFYTYDLRFGKEFFHMVQVQGRHPLVDGLPSGVSGAWKSKPVVLSGNWEFPAGEKLYPILRGIPLPRGESVGLNVLCIVVCTNVHIFMLFDCN